MTTILWVKAGCVAALLVWEFAKGVIEGISSGRS